MVGGTEGVAVGTPDEGDVGVNVASINPPGVAAGVGDASIFVGVASGEDVAPASTVGVAVLRPAFVAVALGS